MSNVTIVVQYRELGSPVPVEGINGHIENRWARKVPGQRYYEHEMTVEDFNRVAPQLFLHHPPHGHEPIPQVVVAPWKECKTVEEAEADAKAGAEAESIPDDASLFFRAGYALVQLQREQLAAVAKAKEEQSLADYATGAGLAREKKPLPADASEAMKRGHGEYTAATWQPEPVKVETPAEHAEIKVEATAPTAPPPAAVEGVDPAAKVEIQDSAPEAAPEVATPAPAPDINALIAEHIPAKNHRLNDLANILNLDPTVLREFIESPASHYELVTGNWVKLKQAAT